MVNADQAALAAIKALLAQQMGCEAQAFGVNALQKIIFHHQRTLGFADLAAYFYHLRGSRTAQADLIEAVVVPETSFFRNPASFDYLHHTLTTPSDHRTWRILSVPCSTGEEPYSIAITLLEAGVSSESFTIDAVDISTNALAQAAQGDYNPYSFRPSSKVQPEILQRYFQWQGNRYRIGSAARSSVYFHQGNLAEVGCLREQSPYDVIFCRNLLIYFHKVARDRTLKHLDRLLVPGGLLFVGHAEARLIDSRRFHQCPAPHAFVFKKLSPALVSHPRPRPQTSMDNIKRAQRPPLATPRPESTSPLLQPQPPPTLQTSPLPELDQIRALADRGILDQAKAECDRYLKTHPTAADAYLLLGEIYQAQGQETAAEGAFQKVLFLNPHCEAALIHLLLHCNQKGDVEAGQRLQQRLNRLLKEDKNSRLYPNSITLSRRIAISVCTTQPTPRYRAPLPRGDV